MTIRTRGLTHLALRVRDVERSFYWGVGEIEGVVALLVSKGAEVHEPVSEVGEGIKVGSVRDPFGNILGVIENPQFRLADVR